MTHWQRRKLFRWTGGALLAGVLQRLCLPAKANTSIVAEEEMIDEPRSNTGLASVALLLPFNAGTQASPAQAVEAGVLAAHAYDGLHLTVHNIATTDTPEAILRAYRAASRQFDVVIGPLSRKAVEVIAAHSAVVKPTIALADPQNMSYATSSQAGMLMIGMPVEDEARHIAYWMEETHTGGTALVVYGNVTWQQRAARAWLAEANKLGMRVTGVQLPLSGHMLEQQALVALRKKIAADMPGQLFCPLNVTQTQQIRRVFGVGIPIFGTSHLNPFIVDRNYGQTYPELDGVRLLDIPWQLAGSQPVNARYRHPAGYFGARPTVDQRRLYALGIDAYRIAQELVQGRREFELDGVTGKLTVAFGAGGVTYFQRQYLRAEFRHGSVVQVDGQSS